MPDPRGREHASPPGQESALLGQQTPLRTFLRELIYEPVFDDLPMDPASLFPVGKLRRELSRLASKGGVCPETPRTERPSSDRAVSSGHRLAIVSLDASEGLC